MTAVLAIGGLGCDGAPTSPPPVPDGAFAVVGCSQTTSAWRAWEETGDDRVWTVVSGYAGGDVRDWAQGIPDGEYWGRLDTNLAANPPAGTVWWQLCELALANATTAQAEAVLAGIRERIPDAIVYASPLADFERPETCGKQDIARSHVLVDHLVDRGLVERGPDLPLVLDAWIQPPEGDGKCHVGETGRAAFGARLASWDWGP